MTCYKSGAQWVSFWKGLRPEQIYVSWQRGQGMKVPSAVHRGQVDRSRVNKWMDGVTSVHSGWLSWKKRHNIELVFCFWNLGQPGFNLALLSIPSQCTNGRKLLTRAVNSNLRHWESRIPWPTTGPWAVGRGRNLWHWKPGVNSSKGKKRSLARWDAWNPVNQAMRSQIQPLAVESHLMRWFIS